MKMPNDEYVDAKKIVYDWPYDKEALQRFYDDIYYKYEDGHECLVEIDKQQTKWTMNLH